MKKVLSSITRWIFSAFGIAILGLLMSLTYQALGRIFPGSLENQIWGLILFDAAAICWALAFVFGSETVGQYAIAALGFLTGFLGTLLMVGAEVMLGQNLTPVETQQVGQWMVYGFIGATALHAILLYAHHATGKEIRQRIDIGIARGEVTTEAIRQATASLDQEKTTLAQTIAADIISQAKRDLGLYPAEGTVFQPKELTAEAPAIPHPEAGAPDNYGPRWKSSTNISPALDNHAWVCLKCDGHNQAYTRECSSCGQPRTNENPITAFADLPSKEAGDTPSPFPGYKPE